MNAGTVALIWLETAVTIWLAWLLLRALVRRRERRAQRPPWKDNVPDEATPDLTAK